MTKPRTLGAWKVFFKEWEQSGLTRKENLIKRAGLGRYNRMSEFDFHFNPNINRQQIQQLASCDFIRKNENILFVGPTGVGKTFLAKPSPMKPAPEGIQRSLLHHENA